MTTFTRVPWAYWLDRVGGPVLIAGIGTTVGVVTLTSDRYELASFEFAAAVLFNALFLVAAALFYRHYPLPVRVELDEREVRVAYLPKKIIAIPRKDVLRAGSRSNGPYGGSSVGILYERGGKIAAANVMGWYRTEDGATLPRSKIIDAINRTLGIDVVTASARESELRRRRR